MIRPADSTVWPGIRSLWRTCFGDSDRYLDFVMQHLLTPDRVLVCLDQGEPVAMLCWREMTLRLADGGMLAGVYIFGVATLPAYRGRGLSSLLLEEAHSLFAQRGIACSTLVPASEALFHFYAQRGYEAFSSIRKIAVDAKTVHFPVFSGVLAPSGMERVERLRDKLLSDCSIYVRWDHSWLRAITLECALSGGGVLRFACGGREGYAAYYRKGNVVVIKELLAPREIRAELLRSLHARLNGSRYVIYQRQDWDAGGEFTNTTLPFSMVRWYDRMQKGRAESQEGGPAYLTHALD